jgi:Spy/CpxP family protein refolding chaperone
MRQRTRLWLGAAALALLGLGAAGVSAAGPGWLGRPAFHFRGHHGHHFDADDVAFVVGWTLREVDASDEQVARVTEIANAAVADLKGLHDAHRARREPFAAALVGADRAALEKLRSEELAAVDLASQRIVAALADAADVLTPEQRQRLAEEHARRHARD